MGNSVFITSVVLYLVQRPAPVKDFRLSVNEYSARVTWDLETSTPTFSYVTKLNVYLNGQKLQTVHRRSSKSHGYFDITGLRPSTVYVVAIETEDGSSQKSRRVSRVFTTKEAGLCTLLYLITQEKHTKVSHGSTTLYYQEFKSTIE